MKFLVGLMFMLQIKEMPCCSNSKNGCRYNCYQTDDGNCIECELGWFGANCSESCILGYYGKLCQTSCECEASLCHKTRGCATLFKLNDSQVTESRSETSNWVLTFLATMVAMCVLAAGGCFLYKNRDFIGLLLQNQEIITFSHHSVESPPNRPDIMRTQEESSAHLHSRWSSATSRQINHEPDPEESHDYNILCLRTKGLSNINQDYGDLYCDLNLQTPAQLRPNLPVSVREDEEENNPYSVAIMIDKEEDGGYGTSM